MLCAFDVVIGPASKEISGIHHNGIWDWRCVHKGAIRGLNLKASSSILKEQRYGS
jgi:hypothetical protein